ncbi:AfsR/SARP family transcriptional regulator [Actinacidiphila acididurans]|uniref:Tetratricopeptide repeat protein n=1 Tax=Actinacidiphila acididurans TaxID=2784346 RepID=A0ABS2TPH9_9ACTN|nr:BTAD domain-containing putative transcriptional regulator [Actinacidiphila acididurans]MBM9505244.1 tetratricopeptide repeat protein [Actinacidiphila acididurans]
MRFGLLGAVSVAEGESGFRALGSAKVRALLAALLATPGRVVSLETLKAALWGEEPPPTATASLHNHVARLRKELSAPGAARLRAVPPGYVLDVRSGELDAQVFAAHHAAAGAAHRDREWGVVLRECGAGLALWRGEPLSGVRLRSDALRAVAGHLSEARLQVLEWRFDAELALGRHSGLAAELGALTEAHPLRETFHRQRMLVLHRTHRQAEALAAFHALRRTLVEELGVEPGAAVQAAYQEILSAPPPPAAPAPAPAAPAPAAPAPSQLPADIPDFTGRDRDLAALLCALRPPGAAAESGSGSGGRTGAGARAGSGTDGATGPRVAVVSGMGGIGKTALAVRAAHLLAPYFPDGRLYADLRGFGAGDARRPADLLTRFLGDLGVDGKHLPDDPADLAGVWRDALSGRRVLAVLDNARDAAQVLPLLPGDGNSAVIVTSRHALAGLPGAARITLEPLGPDEQRELLGRLCGQGRVAAEPEAAAGVLAATGGLPLALRIAGARLAARPAWPLTALAERLDPARGGGRLHALSAGGLAVQDTFAMSYVAMRNSPLPAERDAAAAFRTLGLWPGHPLEPAPAAALLGRSRAAAEDVLEALVDAHLLQTPQPGRYTFHDLLGEYAATCAAETLPEERARALRRLVVWYTATVTATARVLTPEGHEMPPLPEEPAVPAPEFTGDEDAMRWCVRELPAIKEAIDTCARNGWADAAWRLAAGLFGWAQVYWWTGEWLDCLETAMTCVRDQGNVLGQAWMHSRLGVAHGMAGRLADCERHLTVAYRHFEEVGDGQGRAAMLTNLAGMHRIKGEYDRALEYGRRSLELHRELGEGDRVATVLGNLGDAHLGAGDLTAAETCYRQALAAWRERGSLVNSARMLTSLGETLRAQGRHCEAIKALEETLALLDRLGDRATAADVLEILGRTHEERGDTATARACWEEALDLARAHRLPGETEAVLKDLARLDAQEAADQH